MERKNCQLNKAREADVACGSSTNSAGKKVIMHTEVVVGEKEKLAG